MNLIFTKYPNEKFIGVRSEELKDPWNFQIIGAVPKYLAHSHIANSVQILGNGKGYGIV